jgi:DNA-binding GntR family transcriptional regulator
MHNKKQLSTPLAPPRPRNRNAATPASSELARRLARQIALHVQRESLLPGERLVELQLAKRFHVSRSPVRAGLALLESMGVVALEPNRGYVVGRAPAASRDALARLERDEDAPYMRIAAERVAGLLPGEFTEADLMRRYGISRAQLNAMLDRMAREGWVERKSGYGWRFLPVLQSAEAHAQSYRFRMAVEPASLLEPGFRVDAEAFARLRAEQKALIAGRIREVGPAELFEIGSRFHETLAGCSGNPFFLEALRRVDKLRRLIEYRAMEDPARFVKQAAEHLDLLDLIEAGRREEAAVLLRRHLEQVRTFKSSVLRSDTPIHF